MEKMKAKTALSWHVKVHLSGLVLDLVSMLCSTKSYPMSQHTSGDFHVIIVDGVRITLRSLWVFSALFVQLFSVSISNFQSPTTKIERLERLVL